MPGPRVTPAVGSASQKRSFADAFSNQTSMEGREKCNAESPSGFFCIELFAGTAGLTFAMKHFFKSSFGVDTKTSSAKARVVALDLTDENSQQLVTEWATSPNCLWVHFGVPCGTASKARNIRLSSKNRGPPPLRSHKWPLGLPHLSGVSLKRVRTANKLYSFTCRLIRKLDELSKVWTLENPWSSFLWSTPYWTQVAAEISPHLVELDYCMFGGSRKKHTCVATNCESLLELNILCDNQHEHAPWTFENGKFATSEEAAYPNAFSKAMATCVYRFLAQQHGFGDVEDKCISLKLFSFPAISIGQQPTKQLPAVVSGFACIVTLSSCVIHKSMPQVKSDLSGPLRVQSRQGMLELPKGSKLLRLAQFAKGGKTIGQNFITIRPSRDISDVSDSLRDSLAVVWAASDNDSNFEQLCYRFHLFCEDTNADSDVQFGPSCNDKSSTLQAVFGIRWTPLDFVSRAVEVGHPANIFCGLSQEVCNAVDNVANMHPAQVVLARKKWLHMWLSDATKFDAVDADLKRGASEDRMKILQHKKLGLLKAMIDKEKYADATLAEDIAQGFSLVGGLPISNTLPKKFSPSTLSVEQLVDGAMLSRQAARNTTRSCGDPDMDVQLWDKTLSEVDKGWITGPYEWEQLPSDSIVSRRFPVSQTGKIRPIDDYSQSQVNSTVHSYETASVDNVDFICAMFCRLVKGLAANGKDTELLARSLDLSSAYRQLSISESSGRFSFISVFNPHTGGPMVFKQIALPFGPRAAVNAFIRCARCLQWLAATCLHIPLSCYFDDFVLAAPPSLAQNTEACFTILLTLLGWNFDKTGPKADSFSRMVAALGVIFKLDHSGDGIVLVSNTDRRLAQVCDLIDDFLEKGTMTCKQAQEARGRLAFADSYVFGRAGKSTLQAITAHGFAKPFKLEIGADLRRKLLAFKGRLRSGKPRQVMASFTDSWFIYTDAAFESNYSGLGAVLVDPAGNLVAWFAKSLNKDELAPFFRLGQVNIILELETCAVALAIQIWRSQLISKHVVFFVDNEAAKYSLIRGYADSPLVTSLCETVSKNIDDVGVFPWFSRIPSSSNISDWPSRGEAHPWLSDERMTDQFEVECNYKQLVTMVTMVEGH